VEHLRNQCGFCNEELVELRDKCAQCVQQFPFHSFAVPTLAINRLLELVLEGAHAMCNRKGFAQ